MGSGCPFVLLLQPCPSVLTQGSQVQVPAQRPPVLWTCFQGWPLQRSRPDAEVGRPVFCGQSCGLPIAWQLAPEERETHIHSESAGREPAGVGPAAGPWRAIYFTQQPTAGGWALLCVLKSLATQINITGAALSRMQSCTHH